jgi:DNA-binding IclR family transcriptional regulator
LSGLRTLLVRVRQDGFAAEDGTVTPEFSSVAAPVLDHVGYPVAGIAVTYPAAEVTKDQRRAMADQVIRTATDLTRRIGGRA